MKKIKKAQISQLVLSSLCTAVICICAQTAIPLFGVPLTLQTFAVSLCGCFLNPGWGLSAVIVYILLGLFGFPVFTGFRGGFDVLFNATGGFIYGFIFLCIFSSASRYTEKFLFKVLISVLGLILCHICGILHFSIIYKTDVISAALAVSIPYIIKDIFSVTGAVLLSNYLNRIIKKPQ